MAAGEPRQGNARPGRALMNGDHSGARARGGRFPDGDGGTWRSPDGHGNAGEPCPPSASFRRAQARALVADGPRAGTDLRPWLLPDGCRSPRLGLRPDEHGRPASGAVTVTNLAQLSRVAGFGAVAGAAHGRPVRTSWGRRVRKALSRTASRAERKGSNAAEAHNRKVGRPRLDAGVAVADHHVRGNSGREAAKGKRRQGDVSRGDGVTAWTPREVVQKGLVRCRSVGVHGPDVARAGGSSCVCS